MLRLDPIFPHSVKTNESRVIFHQFSNFLSQTSVYIYGMTKMKKKTRVKETKNSLLFFPPFSEGFHIDPLTS
jgi:hypothetical protein